MFLSVYWEIIVARLVKSDAKKTYIVIWNVTILTFLLIIDTKNFGGEKEVQLKSCDASSFSEESSKLSEGIVFYYVSEH